MKDFLLFVYIASVVFYYLYFFVLDIIQKKKKKENGEPLESLGMGWRVELLSHIFFIALSCVPILRLIFVILLTLSMQYDRELSNVER